MTNDVIGKGHVRNRRPWRFAALIPRCEEDGVAVLRVSPVVLEDVLVHQRPLRVLQLEEVLDRPGRSGVGGMPYLPRQRFKDVIQAELYVGGDQVLNLSISPAQQKVFARAFQVVVDYLERPRPVPTADGLRVVADLVEVG